MRYLIFALAIWLSPLLSAEARVSVGIGFPGISIGINMPVYPDLVRVPGYPVYYDPRANYNYFFYDGLYWVFEGDNWYSSSWYNGPWYGVDPYDVPLYVLRVPVRYYYQPPIYFRGWYADAAPRWGEHWGRSWEQRRAGWDRWDRRSVPAAAPLPVYQRQYSGDRYPRALEQQVTIRTQNYRYQPREAVTRQTFQQQAGQVQQGGARAQPQLQGPAQQERSTRQSRVQQNQQTQQTYPAQTQPAQIRRPPETAQQTQQMRRERQDRGPQTAGPPQGSGPQTRVAPQGRGPGGAPPGRGPDANAAVQGRGAENRGGPAMQQGRPAENRAAPQGRGPENANAPNKGRDNNKGAREGKVKDDKKE
ncbi:MAG: hypothetical protein ABI900_11875 [Betaproteobacteria bacterium]